MPHDTSTCHLNGCPFKTRLGAPPSTSETFWIQYEQTCPIWMEYRENGRLYTLIEMLFALSFWLCSSSHQHSLIFNPILPINIVFVSSYVKLRTLLLQYPMIAYSKSRIATQLEHSLIYFRRLPEARIKVH